MRTNARKFRLVLTWLTLVALLLSVFGAVPVRAQTTWHVDDDTCPAVGDGSAGNPFCKIQDAIDAASAGDTINVATGIYHESAHNWVDIQINKSLSLIGAGSSQTIVELNQYGNPPGAHMDGVSIGASDVLIEGIKFTKKPGAPYACGFNIRAGINVGTPPPGNTFRNITLRDVESEHSYGMNVVFDGAYTYENITLENCNIHHGGERNFYESPNTTINGLAVTNCHFDDGGQRPGGDPIGFNLQGTTTNLTITSGTFNNNPNGGLGFRSTTNAAITSVTVTNSGTASWDRSGIGIWEDVSTTSNVQIINPAVTNCGGRGIMFGTWGKTVTNVSVTGGTVSGAGNNGIMLYAGGAGGSVSNITFDGVNVTSSSENNFIGMGDWSGGCSDIAIRRCTMDDPTSHGIFFWAANGGTVTGNNTVTECLITDTPAPYAGFNIANSGGSVINGANFAVNFNSLQGGGNGVRNEGTGVIDASGNWWGTNTPTVGSLYDPLSISPNVDYTPWLDSGTDTDTDTPGFQGDFSTLHVDDDSPQAGTTGRIQEGINMVSSSTVFVHAGTYNERVTISKSVDLRGAQYGVDPTATGARTDPANESTVDVSGLGYANPDIAIDMASGVSDVKVDGFTLIGDPTETLADTSVIRCGGSAGTANNISISNNIIDGKYGVIYKGGDTLTVHQNSMVVNKNGVVVQPNPTSNVTISDNVFNLGTSPAGDESAIYMTACSQCSVTGNVATGFVNAKGLAGSNLSQLTVSGNTFTGNKDAVSIWGSSIYITIHDNDLSSSLRYGISIKGQDVDITGNEINNNGDAGINIERHVIDTERVAIHQNNITGNTNYGVQVDTTSVTEIVDATCNWWGDLRGPYHPILNPVTTGDGVTDNVDFQPWLTQPAPSDCDYEGPITSDVVANPNPVAVNGEVMVAANVDDTNTGGSNIASAEYSLDDGITWYPMAAQDGDFDAVSEDVTATFNAPAEAGIYTYNLCIRGTDSAGNTGPDECIELMLVVYDAEGGFVTGGGWIWSPAGAYTRDSELEGKATFGFVSKYKKGAQTPEGQTEFVFKAANLNFHSDSYDWLVIAGAKAMFKGIGTINGEGEYKFMLTAIDAEINENDSFDVDRFRIKIWYEVNDTEHVVYDNGLGAGDDDDNATTEIGGGSIVIHTKKK